MTLLFQEYNIKTVRHKKRTNLINAALAQLVEHVICNLGVVGPNPTGSFFYGEFLEWSNRTDCKSVGFRLLRFESSTPHLQELVNS